MSEHHWQRSWSRDEICVVDCERCGFKHQWPLPEPEQLSAFYEQEYYQELKPGYIANSERDREWREMQDLEKLASFQEQLKRDEQVSILDVGASSGLFLQTFATRGWRVMGVEPSQWAAEVAVERGLPVLRGLLDDFDGEKLGAPFDVVHMREVLDHMLDPLAVLKRAYTELVAPGGILCIETGNEFNPLQLAMCAHYDIPMWWIVADHISYFDRESLSGLLTRIGFEVTRSEATFPLELFALLGDNYVGQDAVGKGYHLQRVRFETIMREQGFTDAKREMYQALAGAGFGRGVVIYARKPG